MAGARALFRVKGWGAVITGTSTLMLPVWNLPYMLDQVWTITCSRNQHLAGVMRGMLIYVRMNISYNYNYNCRGVAESNLPSGLGPGHRTESGHVVEHLFILPHPRALFHEPHSVQLSTMSKVNHTDGKSYEQL